MSARIPGLTRAEAGAQARRRRAMAHIEKVRNQQQQRPVSLRRVGGLVVGASLLLGLLAGALNAFQRPDEGLWVVGAARVATGELALAAGLSGEGLARPVDGAALVERLEAHPWVASARVLVMPSGALVVGVTERVPAALLEGEPRWAVDARGVPFAPAPDEGVETLLVVEAAERPEPGQASPDLVRALAVAEDLTRLGLPAAEQVAIAAPDDPEGLSLVLAGTKARVVLGRDDLEARLADLARLLDSGLPELEGATRIDLRFEDQAVLDGEPSLEGAEQAAASRGHAAPSNSRRAG